MVLREVRRKQVRASTGVNPSCSEVVPIPPDLQDLLGSRRYGHSSSSAAESANNALADARTKGPVGLLRALAKWVARRRKRVLEEEQKGKSVRYTKYANDRIKAEQVHAASGKQPDAWHGA